MLSKCQLGSQSKKEKNMRAWRHLKENEPASIYNTGFPSTGGLCVSSTEMLSWTPGLNSLGRISLKHPLYTMLLWSTVGRHLSPVLEYTTQGTDTLSGHSCSASQVLESKTASLYWTHIDHLHLGSLWDEYMIHCLTQANPQIGRMCWSSGTTDHNQCSPECACNVTAHIKN